MTAVCLATHPIYAARIYAGTKHFEYRHAIWARPADYLYFYETAPVCKVTGEASIAGIISGTPKEVWDQTKAAAGISKAGFDRYFKGRAKAYAVRLADPVRWPIPMTLPDATGLSRAPQSFAYVRRK